MSAQPSLALRKPQTVTRGRQEAPSLARSSLHVVPAVTKRHLTWPIWLTVIVMMVSALVGSVVINTQMAVTSYEMYAAQQELSQLEDYQADLVTRAREASSPQHLAEKAQEIGLVPAGAPGYVSLASGSVTPGVPAR